MLPSIAEKKSSRVCGTILSLALSRLRNAMAHGLKGRNSKVDKVLKDEISLRASLGDYIKNWRGLGEWGGKD